MIGSQAVADETNNNQPREIRLDPVDGPDAKDAWLRALEELGGPAPSATPVRKPPAPAPSHADVLADDARAKIIDAVNALETFTKTHPYLIAPNVFRMWEENMREIIVMMDRERARSRVEQL
jgi:hypothetical protein